MIERPRRARTPSPVDAVIAAGLVAGAVVTTLQYAWSLSTALALLVSTLSAGVLAWRSVAPRVATIGFAVGLLALAAIDQGPTSTWAFVALLVASFSAAAYLPNTWLPYGVGTLFGAALTYHASVDSDNLLATVVAPLVIVGAPAAAGILLRRARRHASELADLTRELAAEREHARQSAAFAERARVARELHDVISHTVGVMVVQAGAAEKLLDPSEAAAEPVREIRRTGQQAMAELRRVLGILRAADESPPHPQPGVAEIRELLHQAQSTDPVSFDIDLDLELPPGVALTVYRTVQEALTNAQRHARDCAIDVLIRGDVERVTVKVRNDLLPTSTANPLGSSGYGLVGLAERAALYDGSFQAGPTADGTTWRVELTLPTTNPVLAESTA